MAQSKTLKCRGLYTFANTLSETPEGSLLTADNVVIDRDGIITPRRGIKLFGTSMGGAGSSNRSKQHFVYKDRILRHYNTTLQYDSDGAGTFLDFSGTITEVESGRKIRAIEQNGNFYFTTNQGIKKISASAASDIATSSITDSGGVKALDVSCDLNYSQSGFFTVDSTIAYRIVWGIKDDNTNLILGSPSERTVIENPVVPLLIRDFNTLLKSLDTAAAADAGDALSDTNYISTLKISSNSTAGTLYTSLVNLCAKLDTDMSITEYKGRSGQITNASIANPTVITSTAHGLSTGDEITIENADATPTIDGTHVVTVLTANTFSIPVNVTVAGSTGDWKQTSIAHTYSTAPSAAVTSTELANLRAFYDAIVSTLLAEPVGNISAAAQAAGNFQSSSESCVVDVTITIPTAATVNHFFQIYRTPLTTSSGATELSDLDPGDDMQLVYEANPTSAEIAAGKAIVTDITPESFLGANLYTNPNSGEGILQANEIPPLAKDITAFKNITFYANTQTKQRKQLSLLGVSGLNGYAFKIGSNSYNFVNKVKQVVSVTCVAGANYVSVGTSDYFDIYSAENDTHYRVWFQKGTSVAPSSTGVTLVQITITGAETNAQVASLVATALANYHDFVTSVSTNVVTVTNESAGITNAPTENVADAGFSVSVITAGSGEDAATKKVAISDAATPAQQVDETAKSLIRVVNKQASEVVSAFYLSGPNDVPGLILFEARSLGTSTVYFTVSNAAISDKFSPALPTAGTSVATDNEVKPNRIYYSKTQQPEAVPIVNFIDVGPKDTAIVRIVPLRDGLFILTENGIWRLSGDSPNFQVILFDNTTRTIAPDSASVLNNQIYLYCDQGIATISDTGISIISRPLENLVIPLVTYTNFATASWGLSYESDRSYFFFTVSNNSDTVPTQCFRYNIFTNTWTRWPISKTSGVIHNTQDIMYLGAADAPYTEVERKSYSRLDFADRESNFTIIKGGISSDGTELNLGSVYGLDDGDAIVQIQYLTIAQFNRLLKALDSDTGVADSDYYSTLGMIPGDSFGDKLVKLCAKLNADAGVNDTDYTASGVDTFTTVQTEFNTIVAKLNADIGVVKTNYKTSTGTVTYETQVVGIDNTLKRVIISGGFPVAAGPVTTYKRIVCEVTWAPQHFGDATLLKHIRESTILFEYTGFTKASAGYSSDISTGFETIAFNGDGNGTWGGFNWAATTWGGEGSNRPFRTFIPRPKQRCRYINCKFEHARAFEKFGIFGISFTFDILSTRGYR